MLGCKAASYLQGRGMIKEEQLSSFKMVQCIDVTY
jgi:hypothetical protein